MNTFCYITEADIFLSLLQIFEATMFGFLANSVFSQLWLSDIEMMACVLIYLCVCQTDSLSLFL